MQEPPIRSLCVIDDDVIYQFAVKLNLDQLKIARQVYTFSNGELARNFFIEEKNNPDILPQVVLLDINMPVMDGWDFLDWFKEFKQELPHEIAIFMVSSSIDQRDIAKARAYAEVREYLAKPLTEGSFYEMLEILGTQENNGKP